jgi:hypothetical protein
MEIYFPFLRLGGDLPCSHEEAALFLVSLAQHTGVSSGSFTAEGFVTISSVSFGHCTPEGITVNKIHSKNSWMMIRWVSQGSPLLVSIKMDEQSMMSLAVHNTGSS